MWSGLSSYVFGASSEKTHPTVATTSAIDRATKFAIKTSPRVRASSADDDCTIVDEDWILTDRPSREDTPVGLENPSMMYLLVESSSMSAHQHREDLPGSKGSSSHDEDVAEMNTHQASSQQQQHHDRWDSGCRRAADDDEEDEVMSIQPARSQQKERLHERQQVRLAFCPGSLHAALSTNNKKAVRSAYKRKEAKKLNRNQVFRR